MRLVWSGRAATDWASAGVVAATAGHRQAAGELLDEGLAQRLEAVETEPLREPRHRRRRDPGLTRRGAHRVQCQRGMVRLQPARGALQLGTERLEGLLDQLLDGVGRHGGGGRGMIQHLFQP